MIDLGQKDRKDGPHWKRGWDAVHSKNTDYHPYRADVTNT